MNYKILYASTGIMAFLSLSVIFSIGNAYSQMEDNFATINDTTDNNTTTVPSTTPNATTTNNAETIETTPNATTTNNAETIETETVVAPPQGQVFFIQGTVASSDTNLQGLEEQQIAFVLPPREDGGIYSGILTYTASQPVSVAVYHQSLIENVSAIPEEFGEVSIVTLNTTGQSGGTQFALSLLDQGEDSTSASIPFSGNALALHNVDGAPFIATYTLQAVPTDVMSIPSNLQEAITATETEDEETEDEETEDEE